MKKTMLFMTAALLFCGTLSAFEVKERIFPADTTAKICFTAKSPWALDWIKKTASIKIEELKKLPRRKAVPPVGYRKEDHSFSSREEFRYVRANPAWLDFKISGNKIEVDVRLDGENIHHIVFSKFKPGAKRPELRVVKLLSLDKDIFNLRPFKGNVHQHSKVSDGKFLPEEHIAYARLAGFDYIAITDHYRYEQNAPAIAAAAECKSGLTVYPGEEIHTPEGYLHGLSIGGTKKHSFFERRTPAWRKEVQPICDELVKKYPRICKEQLFTWAESLLIARRAKADGALTVYCHPSWRTRYSRNNSIEMAKFLISSKEFDAVEIINSTMHGKFRMENTESMALYLEVCIKTGFRKPVMSSSDSHNVSFPIYARNYNVIFAPDCTFPSFKAAFLSSRSVASYDIDPSPRQNRPEVLHFGASRFVRYANFLDEAGYWQKHDTCAKKQGALIMKYLKGEKKLLPQIEKLAKELDSIREGIYYKAGK